MWLLALRSARLRPASLLAATTAVLLGALLVTACAALLETGLRTADGRNLTTMAGIFGGWTVLVTMFAVASTTSLAVGHRHLEFALLRGIAASRSQLRRMVVAETVAVAAPAAVLGALAGLAAAAPLLSLVAGAGVVPAGTGPHAGPVAIGVGVVVTVLAAIVAATIAGGAVARTPAADAMSDGATRTRLVPLPRLILGLLMLLVAAQSVALTFTPLVGDLPAATAGPASVFVAIAFALLGPLVAARLLAVLGPLVSGFGVPAGLAQTQARARPAATAAAFTPLVLMIGIAVGTLAMQATENALLTPDAAGHDVRVLLAGANYTVSALIIGYTAIAAVNTLVAATARRRREFALLRLTGATRGQVLGTVAVEALLTTVLGAVAGLAAAAATFVPHSLVRTGHPVPDGLLPIALSVVGLAAVVTLAATLGTAWRSLRTPAATAVAATT